MASILYIHGFLSSPNSFKAQQTQKWLAETHPEINFICPQISSYPDIAKQQLLDLVDGLDGEDGVDGDVYAIGSSLGGFWATYLLEQSKVKKAVLVNPAVAPHTRFDEFVGQELKSYYSDEVYRLSDRHLQYLLECDCAQIQYPHRYWLMVQTADETLDYRLAVERYQHCKQLVEEGGSHTFEGYENWLPKILAFLTEPN